MSRSWRAAALLGLGGCVSLDVEAPQLPVCTAPENNHRAPESLVQLYLDVPPYEICNAVVIAPTLLLTAVSCVTPLLSEDDRAGFAPPHCTSAGAPFEDGSFLLRFSLDGPTDSMTVVTGDGSVFESMVNDVFVSSATSTCTPDLAIIQMRLALDLPVVPLRLARTDVAGDEVVVEGYDLIEGTLQRHASTATIVESTFDSGSSSLPPRSLSLSGDTCAKPGGAVLTPTTGALVAIIQTTERTINCDSATAPPVAVRIAPYREFLLDVARTTQMELVAEFGSDTTGLIPACPDVMTGPPTALAVP